MLQLGRLIKDVIEEYVQARMFHDHNAQVRLVLVGPPREALEASFNLLTNNATSEWHVSIGGQEHDITVLWIDTEIASTPTSALKSQRCNWDYAITIRNSVRQVVSLVSSSKLDSMQESITNATDTIGTPRLDPTLGRWWAIQPWSEIVKRISENLGTSKRITREALIEVMKTSMDLEPAWRDQYPWMVANQLLEPLATLPSSEVFASTIGLPFFDEPITEELFRDGVEIVKRLGKFLEQQGLGDGINALKEARTAKENELGSALDELSKHILKCAGSGLGFSRAPTWFYRPSSPLELWWRDLTMERLNKALEEAGSAKKVPKKKRLGLSCENALDGRNIPGPDPAIVLNRVELRAKVPPGDLVPTVKFQRTIGRSVQEISATDSQGDTCVDEELIADGQLDEKPIKYSCLADDHEPGKIEVVVLDRFACQGVARVREADRNNVPSKPKKEQTWRQEIRVSRAGVHDFDIYHSSNVATVEIWHEGNLVEQKPASIPVRFILEDVEHNYSLEVVLKASDGSRLSTWTVEFSVTEESARKAQTRFDALVQAHQERKRQPGVVQPRNVPIRQLEHNYLTSPSSWQPAVACWESGVERFPIIDWNNLRLGTIVPHPNPCPMDLTPPPELIEARDSVRTRLLGESRQLVEIDLAKPELGLQPLVEVYLKEYLNWLQSSPSQATWFDCLAVHVPEQNVQAGQVTASSEPYAILLSPLHPLRFGWQYLAQSQLIEAMSNHCPAAGLLYPHGCPSIGCWTLYAGTGYESQRAFFAISCDNPYWAILLNRQYLKPSEQHQVLQVIAELGLEPRGLVGRFTESQAENTLNEVVKILSARAVLRVGIVGPGEATSDCIEGITSWCDQQFSEEGGGRVGKEKVPTLPPHSVEIYYQVPSPSDSGEAYGLSSEKIAALSERTGERVRWFVQPESQVRVHDLVILDQLGIYDPRGEEGTARSPIGNGVLYRSKIREDTEGALWLVEARIAKAREASPDIMGLLEQLTLRFEELATSDGNIAQLRFRPNQQAIGQRLEQNSRFVAVTSSQVDPACFSRSAEAQRGFVWDYEVPGALGIEEKSAGYYLVTRPSDAMKTAINRAASLITEYPVPIEDLLNEVSRRGIPILKRMAAGGSTSRGEMGMLLAVRLLQDAFRSAEVKPRLSIWENNCIHLILPVDPYEAPVTKLGQAINRSFSPLRYADLLVFAIHLPEDQAEPVQLKITPLEVKFREGRMSPSDLGEALEQAASLGGILAKLWTDPLPGELWKTCGTALLSQFVEYAFRIYADERVHKLATAEWTQKQEEVLQAILCQNVQVTVVSAGRLIVFDGSDLSEALDMDNDGSYDTAIICRADAEVLLTGQGILSSSAEQSVAILDFSLPDCHDVDAAIVLGQPSIVSTTLTATNEAAESRQITLEGFPPSVGFTVRSMVSVVEDSTSYLDEDDEEETETRQSVYPDESRQIIPPGIRREVDLAFEGFIGNQRAVETLKRSLLKARVEKPPHLDKNFLLIGPPSTGKTDLSRRMATALDLPFIHVDGRMIKTREKLFELIDVALTENNQSPRPKGTRSGLPIYDYPSFVVFIDEVHLVPKKTQEALLTLLERSDRTVALESPKRRIAQVTRATFLFATTRPSELDKPFRTRCLDVPLERYTHTEVAEIVHRFEPSWPRDVLLAIATYSRLVPRKALAIAQELKDEILVSADTFLSVSEHLEKVARTMGIDEYGLTELDIQYLEVLERARRPIGESVILSLLGTVDKDAVLDEVEPYLAHQMEFIRMERQGRAITEKGKSFLLERRRKGKNLGNPRQ
jgi:Holliday junction resolvasome RuvABC ATP-dependent DNA helicase subunit